MTVPPNPQSLVGVIEINATKDAKKPSTLSLVELWCASNCKAILAEIISTTLLLVFGCMSCIPLEGYQKQPPLYGPLGFGFAVLINVLIFGHISGAHMNPSVTLAAIIWGKTPMLLGIAYVIAQCIGATLGFGILFAISPIDLVPDGVCVTLPHAEHNVFQALGVEMVLTAALCFICCAVWDPINEHKEDSIPLKFGFAIAGLGIAGGPLTGASMNPARSLGPAIWTGMWSLHWVYWAGPMLGSVVATVFYKYIWLNDNLLNKYDESNDK